MGGTYYPVLYLYLANIYFHNFVEPEYTVVPSSYCFRGYRYRYLPALFKKKIQILLNCTITAGAESRR